jgi:hypothetical protein
MTALWIGWATGAAVLLAAGVAAGLVVNRRPAGILIDGRGSYSLSRLQLALWTLTVASLVVGVTVGRLATRGTSPLEFSMPAELLGLLGLSVGTTVVASAVKSHKSSRRPAFVAATPRGTRPQFRSIVLVEEGPDAEKTIDLTKLQSLVLTLILVAAYVALAVHTFAGWGASAVTTPADITSLPGISPTFLTLLGISHVGYLGGKLPDRGGDDAASGAPAHSVEQRRAAIVIPAARQDPPTAPRYPNGGRRRVAATPR